MYWENRRDSGLIGHFSSGGFCPLPPNATWCHDFCVSLYSGAKLTQEELGDLLGKLASVTTTLQEREKAKKKSPEVTFNLPKLPEWLSTRTYLTRDYVIQPPLTSKGGVVEGVALGSMPAAMQEQAILEDLLSAMMGQDGR